MLADYDVAGAPDLTLDQLARILRDAQSPATPEAIHIHAALKATGVRPSVWLAFFFVESKMGTVGIVKDFDTKNAGNVRSPEVAALGSVIQTPRGPFARYLTWADGAYDWGKRLTGPKYGQAGLKTVKQVLPKYAPSGDSNDPDAYARTALQKIEEWTKGAPPVPLTIREAIIPRQANRPGTKLDGGKPGGIVIHETANTSVGANAEMHRKFLVNGGGPESVSFHYCVDDKEAVHLLPDDEEGHHAGDGLGPGSCGSTTLGIELCVNADGDWAKTRVNGAQLVAHLLKKHGLPASSIKQHFNCSGKNCPTKLRANSNAQWSGFLAGVNAAYALLAGPGATTPEDEGIRTYINERGVPVTEIVWGGQAKRIQGTNIVDVGVSVTGMDDGTYDRSVQANQFRDWAKRP